MDIRNVTTAEWEQFRDGYPYERFEGMEKEFQIDCIFHSVPNQKEEVIGVYEESQLVGLLSYFSDYLQIKVDGQSRSAGLGGKADGNSTPLFYISTMIVHPDWRKKGISSALISFVEQQKKHEEYMLMYPVSEECRSLAEKLGFTMDTPIFIQQEDVAKKI